MGLLNLPAPLWLLLVAVGVAFTLRSVVAVWTVGVAVPERRTRVLGDPDESFSDYERRVEKWRQRHVEDHVLLASELVAVGVVVSIVAALSAALRAGGVL